MLDELYLNKIIYIHMYKSLRVKLLRKLTNLLGWCGGGSDGRGEFGMHCHSKCGFYCN